MIPLPTTRALLACSSPPLHPPAFPQQVQPQSLPPAGPDPLLRVPGLPNLLQKRVPRAAPGRRAMQPAVQRLVRRRRHVARRQEVALTGLPLGLLRVKGAQGIFSSIGAGQRMF
jgi:hypothetical protein